MVDDLRTDEELVYEILAGDDRQFRVLVKRHQDMVFSIGRRFFRNDDDASDVAQEAFIKAYQNLGSFKGTAPFRFWLYRIAYNCAVNRTRAKGSNEVYLVDEALESSEPAVTAAVESDEVKELLRSAVDKLPPQYRLCVDLFFFGAMSYPEIHGITGIPVNTIKSNVFRAKQILRDELKGTIAEDYHEL